MMEEIHNACLVGRLVCNFQKSYNNVNMPGVSYTGKVASARFSGVEDNIVVVISEDMYKQLNKDTDRVIIYGDFRSRNTSDDKGRHLTLELIASIIEELKQDDCDIENINTITLDGIICKKPNLRITHLGRQIADVLIAVNYDDHSDYIPCIFWGESACKLSKLNLGDKICICGRIQSRRYVKKYEGGRLEEREAYEVSVREYTVL